MNTVHTIYEIQIPLNSNTYHIMENKSVYTRMLIESYTREYTYVCTYIPASVLKFLCRFTMVSNTI